MTSPHRLFTKTLPLIISFLLLSLDHKAAADGVFPWQGLESLWDGPTIAGADGQTRLIFGVWGPSTPANPDGIYLSARIGLLNKKGSSLTFCSPDIPNYTGKGDYPFSFGQADGNTTLGFWLSDGSLGVWTYNGFGQLISTVRYGPFSNAQMVGLRFTQGGSLMVHWQDSFGQNIGWLLDEYGAIISSLGPYGSYANTALLQIIGQKNDSMQWIWRTPPPLTSANCTNIIWTFSAPQPNGKINVFAANYGPF